MILPFTGKRHRHIEVYDGFNRKEPTTPAAAPATARNDVATTCAIDVVQALQFYAAGSTDGGQLAQRTLAGMHSVIQAANE